MQKQILSRRSRNGRAAEANPFWFALSSVSGSRLVPSDRPRASDTRFHASPEIRVSLAGLRRQNFEQARYRKTKNPPERWLGRVRVKRIVDIA